MDKGKVRKKRILKKLPAPKGEYSVVKFLENAAKLFECIPDNWFVDENKEVCFWPPKGKSVTLRAINYEEPDRELWESFSCILISEGHLTYSSGSAIVRQKSSQKYNTSSADEHMERSVFHRKHPGLISQSTQSFEDIFANAKKQKNEIEPQDKQTSKKIFICSGEENVEIVNEEVCSSSRSTSTAESNPKTGSPLNLRSDRPTRSPVKSPIPTTASMPRSRSRSTIHHSRSRSSKSSSGSESSCSESRKSRSGSRSSRSKSRSSRSKSRSSRSKSKLSQSRSETSGSGSRSSVSGKESSRTRGRSRSRQRRSKSRSRFRQSRSTSPKSSSESHTGSHSRSRNEYRYSRNFRRSIHRAASDALNPSTRNEDWSSKFYSDMPLKMNQNASTKRDNHHRSEHTNSYERHRNELPSHEVNVSSNDCTSRDLINAINGMKKSIDETNKRLAENDRRMDRIEVVINKVFLLVSNASRFNAPLELTEPDADNNPYKFEVPKIPVMSIRELTVLNRKLKSKRFRSFLVGHQKEFCAPSTTTTDTVVITAYLQKFISLAVRSDITLKEPKGTNGLTLCADFRYVYLYLIDVVKAGYQLNKRTITTDQCHVALRIVWGRSNQLLKNQDNRRHKNKRHQMYERHEKSYRKRK